MSEPDAGADIHGRVPPILSTPGWFWTGSVLLTLMVAVFFVEAVVKASAGDMEWSYWSIAVSDPTLWREINLGYLPAFSAVLRPFFALGDLAGSIAFTAIAVACSAACFHLLWRAIARETPAMPWRYGPWQMLWLAAPFMLALRNSQMMIQMMAVMALGLASMSRGRMLRGAALVGLAAIFKPLSLTIGGYLLFKRRLMTAAAIGVVALTASFLLLAFDVGPTESLQRHLDWPTQIASLTPDESVLASEMRREAYGADQGLARALAEAGVQPAAAAWIHRALAGTAFIAVAWVFVLRRPGRTPRWDEIALWLAWTIVAAPFSRYYYLLLLMPAWLVVIHATEVRRLSDMGRKQWVVTALPLLLWAGRTPWIYLGIAWLSFGLILHHVMRGRR